MPVTKGENSELHKKMVAEACELLCHADTDAFILITANTKVDEGSTILCGELEKIIVAVASSICARSEVRIIIHHAVDRSIAHFNKG